MNVTRRQITIAGSAFLALTTLGLSAHEYSNPGFCPNYPIINIPACYVMAMYLTLLTASLLITTKARADQAFYTIWSISLVSSIYFSIREIANIENCPQILGIPLPLCFLVPPTLLVLLWLRRAADRD